MRKAGIAGGVALLLIGGYTWMWFQSAQRLQKNVVASVRNLREQGYEVNYKSLALSGFPFTLKVKMRNAELAYPQIFKTWCRGRVTFSTALWTPGKITGIFHGDHHIVLHYPDEKIVHLKGTGGEAALYPFEKNIFRYLSCDYETLTLWAKDMPVLKAKEVFFTLRQHDEMDRKHPNSTAEIETQIKHLSLPSLDKHPLGSGLQDIKFDAVLRGTSSLGTPLQMARTWSQEGGSLDINQLYLNWNGLKIESEGTLTLAEDLQPIAAFTANISGINTFFDALVGAKFLDEKHATFAKFTLGFLTPESDEKKDEKKEVATVQEKDRGLKISFTLQDGAFAMGPVSLFSVPRLDWPTAPLGK